MFFGAEVCFPVRNVEFNSQPGLESRDLVRRSSNIKGPRRESDEVLQFLLLIGHLRNSC